MKFVYSAGVILFHRTAHAITYLLLKSIGGHWDFPKGKREPGETIEQTALRELKEETGLDGKIYDGFHESLSYIFTDRDRIRAKKQVDYFVAQATEEEVVISSEHVDYIWLPYEQAVQHVTYPNAKKILYKAHHFITTSLTQ